MALAASCPRCTSPLTGEGVEFRCDTHGGLIPLWRSATADYASFAEVVTKAGRVPTYLPWPIEAGWTLSDLGCVAGSSGTALATVTTTAGVTALDGDVEITVVSEEPGVGLGHRAAGWDTGDPGQSAGRGPATMRLRVDGHPVSMWVVPSPAEDGVLARAVLAGESGGRWLWVVVRPASAILLLGEDWPLADASAFGPEAIDLPFGGTPPTW